MELPRGCACLPTRGRPHLQRAMQHITACKSQAPLSKLLAVLISRPRRPGPCWLHDAAFQQRKLVPQAIMASIMASIIASIMASWHDSPLASAICSLRTLPPLQGTRPHRGRGAAQGRSRHAGQRVSRERLRGPGQAACAACSVRSSAASAGSPACPALREEHAPLLARALHLPASAESCCCSTQVQAP